MIRGPCWDLLVLSPIMIYLSSLKQLNCAHLKISTQKEQNTSVDYYPEGYFQRVCVYFSLCVEDHVTGVLTLLTVSLINIFK